MMLPRLAVRFEQFTVTHELEWATIPPEKKSVETVVSAPKMRFRIGPGHISEENQKTS